MLFIRSYTNGYIGQTSRILKTRIKEHARAITTMDKNPVLAEHHLFHQHEIDPGGVRTGIAMHHGRKENYDHLCQVVVECTSCRRRRRRTVFVISAAKISELAMFSLKEPY